MQPMRKLGNSRRWFILSDASRVRNERRDLPRARQVRLEELEPRYVLTAPVAVPDSITMDANVAGFSTPHGQILALDNDTDEDSLHSVLKIVEVGVGEGSHVLGSGPGNITIPLEHGTLTVVYQSAHY